MTYLYWASKELPTPRFFVCLQIIVLCKLLLVVIDQSPLRRMRQARSLLTLSEHLIKQWKKNAGNDSFAWDRNIKKRLQNRWINDVGYFIICQMSVTQSSPHLCFDHFTMMNFKVKGEAEWNGLFLLANATIGILFWSSFEHLNQLVVIKRKEKRALQISPNVSTI